MAAVADRYPTSSIAGDSIAAVIIDLREGAVELRQSSTTRNVADAYHARIDAERLMMQIADRLVRLQGRK